ncbi:16S rRNA (adenine(1518)-N(6)/adenine(1519)-N(6))-dimethyltransferase RsmA [Pseudoclavibacter alba]|uniref:Ribosomal RNA small subunit methyltransferase A n=1 Tax=Pseudoclavibacter albus TaxID=272241 RepID=A0ABT2HWV5_9MICO|nr:16S rRNA (adenine(1518)-N(6)/adenine(1519)-N(6))-dimethyltransferase RsmA [Pseudoclavibacter alba]MBN6777495.1 16S rRNA (adenine(1518)-N(6)/adenine(1519)-N(6))-dimethyltransferase RsmA [Pseudoclavibacter alba]MCT2042790.1 16S rRNA (adenine(1518)-N(6)/adenine(1519)-N(6))-dimethyltransferase RsmA [Pseudoclavibacter alba]
MTGATLLGAAEIRELAVELDVTPTKKLGQNFVHDANTVRRIAEVGRVAEGEHILEVGPGLGSLTLAILERGARMTAIEIDPRLAAKLPETVAKHAPGAELTVVLSDALQVDGVAGEPVAIVANLPYNVSVPVLLHLLACVPSLERGVVMVQAEVGERLAAGPGSKVYGAPSVKAAWYGSWRTAGLVSRRVFWPEPNVDSILVAYERGESRGDEALRARVFALVDAAFGQRRKMLRQALASVIPGGVQAVSEVLEAADIAPTARGEALTIDDFVRLAKILP